MTTPNCSEVTLVLDATATIEVAEDVHQRLTEALDRAVTDRLPLAVDCGAVARADVTLLHLLLAAAREASEAGSSLHLDRTADGAVAGLAAAAGLAAHPLFASA